MNSEITDKQKNAAAVMLVQRTVEIYSEEKSLSFDVAFAEFVKSPLYDAIFDFETGLWREGPVYILDLLQRTTENKNV